MLQWTKGEKPTLVVDTDGEGGGDERVVCTAYRLTNG